MIVAESGIHEERIFLETPRTVRQSVDRRRAGIRERDV